MSTEGGRHSTVTLSILGYSSSTALLGEKSYLQKFCIFRGQLLAGFGLILWLHIKRNYASRTALAVPLPVLLQPRPRDPFKYRSLPKLH